MTDIAARDVEVKTLVLRIKLRAAKVPLADGSRGVTEWLEGFGQGDFFQGELLLPGRQAEAAVAGRRLAGNPIRDVQPRGIFSRHNGRARRRADSTRSIGLGESHACGRKPIYVWRAIKLAAKASAVCPTHVIDQNENNIGRLSRLFGGQGRRNDARTESD